MSAAATGSVVPWLDRLERVMSRQIFFVVGCQKSGTTWVQKLLDGHPRGRCHGESYFGPVLAPLMKQVAQTYNQKHKAGELGHFTDEDVASLVGAGAGLCLSRWAGEELDELDAIGEKTPEHSLCLPVLDRALPGMKVVHVIRDGRDACVSGWFHNRRKPSAFFEKNFPRLEDYARYMASRHWGPYITEARRFGAAHPQRYHEVRYEALHAEPGATIAGVLRFLGLSDDAESVEACAQAGAFSKLTAGRSRGEEDAGSFFRKGVVGDWSNHMTDRDLAAFRESAGPLLDELGYG